MKMIPLTGKNGFGQYAIVDDRDYEWLSRFKWHLNSTGYPKRYMSVRESGFYDKSISIHRSVWERHRGPLIPGFELDHINGNRQDTRLSNLRACTHLQNSQNRLIGKNNKSGYKGVTWYGHAGLNKWVAHIRVDKKLISLGYFDDLQDAAQAYRQAAIKHFGKFAAV